MLHTGLYWISNKTTKFKSQAGTSELGPWRGYTLTVGVRPYARTVYYWTCVGRWTEGQEIQNANHMVSARGYVAVLVFPIFYQVVNVCANQATSFTSFSPPPPPALRPETESVTTGNGEGALFVKSRRGHSRVWFGFRFPLFLDGDGRDRLGRGRVGRRQGMGRGRGLGGRL